MAGRVVSNTRRRYPSSPDACVSDCCSAAAHGRLEPVREVCKSRRWPRERPLLEGPLCGPDPSAEDVQPVDRPAHRGAAADANGVRLAADAVAAFLYETAERVLWDLARRP